MKSVKSKKMLKKMENNRLKQEKFAVCCFRFILYTLLFTLCSLHVTVFAAFEDIGVGARPISMANAFTAVADDVHSVYYNPAGLAGLTKYEVASSYGKLFWGLTDNSNINVSFLAGAAPVSRLRGVVGIGINQLKLDNLYWEDQYILTYGREINSERFGMFSIGSSLKILSHKFGRDDYTDNAIDETGVSHDGVPDPVFEGGRGKTSFAVDFGVIKNYNKMKMGISLLNINQPSVGLSDKGDRVPFGFKSGFSHKGEKSTLAFEFSRKDGDNILRSGLELSVFEKFDFRCGLEIGSRDFANINFGFGYRIENKFFVDYSFILPAMGVRETYGTHRVSLNAKFEVAPSEKVEKVPSKKRIEKAEKHYMRGVDFYLEEDLKNAEKEFKKVLEIDPGNQPAIDMLKECGVVTKAEKPEAKVVEMSEEERETLKKKYFGSATKYYLKENYAKAVEMWEKVLQLDPSHELSRQKIEKAEKMKALKEKAGQGSQVEYHYMRGVDFYLDEDIGNAKKEFKEVIKIDPAHRPTIDMLKECEK
ncbi:MAG: type IX secretion system membrane protein PorP/SprF [bacterium]